MIEFCKAYVSGGKTYATLKEAKAAEIAEMLAGATCDLHRDDVVVWVMEHADKIVDILTTKGDSRPKARALNGGRKPRKAATNGTPEPPTT